MLSKFLKIGIIFFITSLNFVYSDENFTIKHHKLKISSLSGNNLNKIGIIKGNIEEYPYGISYYLHTEDNKISELIETFYFENYGDHVSRFNNWARSVVYIANPKHGCNNSDEKLYNNLKDNGPTHFNCFSVRLIDKFDQIYGPNFNRSEHIKLNQRESFLSKYLSKNSISLPNKMFRVESYLYRGGKLIWVFYTLDSKLFYKNLNDKNIEKFINKAISVHQNFEEDLKFKPHMKIDVLNRLETLFDKGIFSEEEFKKAKETLNF